MVCKICEFSLNNKILSFSVHKVRFSKSANKVKFPPKINPYQTKFQYAHLQMVRNKYAKFQMYTMYRF